MALIIDLFFKYYLLQLTVFLTDNSCFAAKPRSEGGSLQEKGQREAEGQHQVSRPRSFGLLHQRPLDRLPGEVMMSHPMYSEIMPHAFLGFKDVFHWDDLFLLAKPGFLWTQES